MGTLEDRLRLCWSRGFAATHDSPAGLEHIHTASLSSLTLFCCYWTISCFVCLFYNVIYCHVLVLIFSYKNVLRMPFFCNFFLCDQF